MRRHGEDHSGGVRPSWLDTANGLRLTVLGADGFIGSSVVSAALRAGATVTALCAKDPWRLAGIRHRALELVAIPAPWWDKHVESWLGPQIEGAAALLLLAYRPPDASEASARLRHELTVNATGAGHVAETAAARGARVVFASSADVYGPWHENAVGENLPPAPFTAYARAKLEAERLVAESTDGQSISLRIATVFGPGETGRRAIPSFVRALTAGRRPIVHGTGADVRDYVHVDDVAAAFVNASARRFERLAPVVNVGSGEGRSTLEVLRAVEFALGVQREPEFVPATRPPSRLVLAIDRARAALGLSPRADFERGVAEEARWLIEART